MLLQGFFQIALTLVLVVILAPILGGYLARVFMAKKTFLDPVMTPVERIIYLLSGIEPEEEMTGWEYAQAVLISNSAMAVLVFLLLMFQAGLPLNPTRLGMPTWDTVLHTTISFLVAADLQHYSGETTMSYLSQIAALGFLMFVAPATGAAVGIAFIRGLTGRRLGNFYVDLIRFITRILLPVSIMGAVLLLIAGVPETLAGPETTTLEGATQAIARGPVAHFESIKMLGENGGGFFGASSAHPYENPNGATNLLEVVIQLLIPTAFIYTYGIFIGNTRQTWLLFWMLGAIFVALIGVTAVGEYLGNPLVESLFGGQQPNLEGKEVRLGWAQTALFAVTTTATMTGSSNAAFDSLMPAADFCALLNMFIQVIWGSVGTGTAHLFVYLFLAVFLTGLMVGRTPEFIGRKIDRWEITLIGVIVLIHPILILIPASITLAFPDALAGISNPGFHGLTQVVYEYTSAAAGNGSGMAGLGNSQPAPTALWWNLTTAVVLWAGRFIPIIALLLLTDSMSLKQTTPVNDATLRTDTGLFTGITAATILILGVLTFLPVLALGPVAESFQLAPDGRA